MAPIPKSREVECEGCGASGKLIGLIHKPGCTCKDNPILGAPGTFAKAARAAAKAAVAAELTADPTRSSRAIADIVGVDKNLVEDMRKSTGETSPVGKRIGKDGRTRKLPSLPETGARNEKIVALADAGVPKYEIADEVGIGERMIGRVLEIENAKRSAEAQIDPASLSTTAQEKLAAAMRQQERRLDLAFEARVREECRRRIDDIILPEYLKEIADAKEVIKARKGVMRRATFKKILACLHPDLVDKERRVRYTEAFQLFKDLEIVLCNEAELPTATMDMPRSYAEALARKQKISEARRRRPAPPSGPSAPARNL